MKTRTFLALLTIGTLLACNNSKKETVKYKSFELSSDNRDTINVIDINGHKQGIWIKPSVKDTLIYFHDTAFSPVGTTSRELIRFLNKRDTLHMNPKFIQDILKNSNG